MAVVKMDDLLKKKEKKSEKKTALLHVESLGGEIVVEIPSRSFCVDVLKMAAEGRDDEADAYAVYNLVVDPSLKDKKLQEAFGCSVPTEIVDKIFRPGEVAAISGHCMELAGYGEKSIKRIDEDIKN